MPTAHRIEAPWLAVFEDVLRLCGAEPGLPVCLLAESRSRALNLDLAELAAAGVREFALILTHPKLRGATCAWTSPIALV